MSTKGRISKQRLIGALVATVFLFLVVAIPASAAVGMFRNAFNPRGYFVTLKSTDQSEWLRSTFTTGFYRSGSGGDGTGGGNGGMDQKDELGHSNVTYSGVEDGLDYVDAEDVDTIYATFDHNPTPGKQFLIGYAKDEQAGQLAPIPNFADCIGNPIRPGPTDPSGGAWWSIPVHLSLGEELEDGSKAALATGTVYEFAFQRGLRANNGTTCVLVPGETPGTYLGYLSKPETPEEKALYDAHKFDEYEFITGIYPEGSSALTDVEHTLDTVPMRYRVQTYASLKSWDGSAEYKEATDFLESVTEADYSSGRYVRENVENLRSTLDALDEEAETTVKYQLQKDADWTILQMLDDLKSALEAARQSRPAVNFDNYNASLQNAEIIYNDLKDQTGTHIGEYRQEPITALKQAIDHAKSTINEQSTQEQLNTEEAALDAAVMDAMDALITSDEELIFTDSATGIIVTAKASSLPSNARLVVREVVSGTTEYDEMVARISPVPDKVAIYRILFYDGQDVIQPTAPVTVQIPLVDELAETAPNVYYLDNTGSAARQVDASTPEGYRIVETSTLGTFVVGGVTQEKPEGLTTDPTPEEPTTQNQPEEPTTQKQQEPASGNSQQEPSSQVERPTVPSSNTPANPVPPVTSPQNEQAQPSSSSTTRQQSTTTTRPPVTTQPPVHSTTRTTTRPTASRTTRILRTTRNDQNDQSTRNEITSTSIYQTQAVQPTTRTTTTVTTTALSDSDDLEQDANQHTLLYIALAVAVVGLGAAGLEMVRDEKGNGNGSDETQL